MRHLVVVLLVAMSLSACTYQAKVGPTPAFGIASSYEAKVPGTFMLIVHSFGAQAMVRPQGLKCSAHKFLLNLSEQFRTSAQLTIERLVERLVVAQKPISADEMQARGIRGIITVTAGSLYGSLSTQEGLFTSTTYAETRFGAEIVVDGPEGRLLGATGNGIGSSQADSGLVCEGGAPALARSAATAMRNTMRQIGEALANAPKLRVAGAVPQATPVTH